MSDEDSKLAKEIAGVTDDAAAENKKNKGEEDKGDEKPLKKAKTASQK